MPFSYQLCRQPALLLLEDFSNRRLDPRRKGVCRRPGYSERATSLILLYQLALLFTDLTPLDPREHRINLLSLSFPREPIETVERIILCRRQPDNGRNLIVSHEIFP